jgi:hypothetical protein
MLAKQDNREKKKKFKTVDDVPVSEVIRKK